MEAFIILGRGLILLVGAPEAGVGASTLCQAVSSRNVTMFVRDSLELYVR